MGQITKIVKKKIGREEHSFMITGDNFHDVIMQSQKLSFPNVAECGICGSDSLRLSAHVTNKKKHKYTHISCNACKAQLNFGQQTEDMEIYYLRTKKDANDKMLRNEKGFPVYDWQKFEDAKREEE